jgi:hypothetical protein
MVTGGPAVIRLAVSAVRTILTWGLVAAVAAVGLAAGIDALRGGDEPDPSAATGTEPGTTVAVDSADRTFGAAGADLRRAGVPEGRLVYSDADCGIHVLLLPDLAERPAHDALACSWGGDDRIAIFGSPGGSYSWGDCADGRLLIMSGPPGADRPYARARGCAPAWKPDGTLTFVRDGGVRRFVPCPRDPPSSPLLCSEPVLTPAQLARELRGPGWRNGPRIKELAWLDDERFAAIVQGSPNDSWYDHLALFDRGRLVGEPVGPYAELDGLTASPSGSRVVSADMERGGLVAIDGNGRQIQLALDEGHAIAWSPDEEWIAEATEGGIYVWRADDESPDPIHIPVVARKVAWTAPPDDDEAALAEARDALRAAGVPEGTLTYADENCRSHELSLPDLGQAGSPLGYQGLCRYRASVGGVVETLGPPRSPDWRVEARCEGGLLRLVQREFGVDEPHVVAEAPGCGAAWKPDGTVTFVQDGSVRRFVRCPGDGQGTPLRCSAPVLTRGGLGRQLPGGPWTVRELHWLDDTRFAAIVRRRGLDYLAIVDRGRVVRRPAGGFRGLVGLKPSPRGRFVAAYERNGGLVGTLAVVNRAGRSVQLPVERGRGVAWSPDENWVAVADKGGIWVFRADGTGLVSIRIPLPARDVLWTRQ